MTKKLILPIIIAALASVASCNSDSPEYKYSASSSVMVKAFSLTDDYHILDSLSNVFFTIDLENARIFNADSLPYGTRTDKLIPVIDTESNVSSVLLEVPRPNMTDSIMNFLENSTDSVDFSCGPVKLRVKSQSGTNERVYEIKVNVHQVKPDTLAWAKLETNNSGIPTQFDRISASKVVKKGSDFLALTANADTSLAVIYASSLPSFEVSSVFSVISTFKPKVSTLTVAGDDLYILDDNGKLICLSNQGLATNQVWENIYGTYGSEILGCKKVGSQWKIAAYPSGKEWDMPAGFPVYGTAQPIIYDSDMAFAPQMILAGGIDANSRIIQSSWGFDGTTWACYGSKSLPKPLHGLSIVAYDLFYVPSSTWRPVQYPALLAFGGSDDSGINRTVYLSQDWGLTWREAPQLVQLPASMTVTSGASALVHSYTLDDYAILSSRSARWSELAVRSIPPFCSWVNAPLSRIEKPITQWQCPVIYVYGGTLADGSATTQAWRGAILRYTFAPKY